ncbi:MAG: phytoene desaturase family protein [Deltaproteobacteria bacterium]|nr:phytoene desaturase family protein [Deltaproteobacteria bacterium]
MHVVIVGAGPGGLAAAINLAGRGITVTVLEKDAIPGGRMKGLTFGQDNEYTVDTGPSILQLPGIYEALFARAGKSLADYVTLMPLEPGTKLHFWDQTSLETSRDPEVMARNCEALSAGRGDRFRAWMAESEGKYRIAYEKFIAHPADSLDYYNPLRLLPTLPYRPWESLYKQLDRAFDDDRITYALAYPSKYLGLHPTTCSSVFSVIPYIELAFGVWHVAGGFRALARGMQRCAEDLGATFVMNTPVAQLWVEDVPGKSPRTRGVILTSGERVEADAVVINADLPWAAKNLVPARYRRMGRTSDTVLEHSKYSCSTMMLYLGLDRVYDELPHHMIYLSESARRTDRDAIEDRTLDTVDPPFYVCNPTPTDPSGAPQGHSTLYVLVPTPNTSRDIDWKRAEEVMTEKIPTWLEKVGIRDVRSHIRAQRVFTAETWRDDFNVARGAVFNLSHTWLQLGAARPRVQSPDIDGLFYVGGGTHPGSGLLTILESANIAGDYLSRAAGKGPLPQWPHVP